MFQFQDIAKITKGIIINGDYNQFIRRYSTSRMVFEEGIFYVPIVFKGNDYEKNIISAVENGALGFMIHRNSIHYQEIVEEALKMNPEVCILAVDDVNLALYDLGLEARKLNFSKEVIAVTGSYGKSTLTSLISKVLETEMKVLHDFCNDNSNTRWHLSRLLQYFDSYDIAVFELGTSDFGRILEMSKLVCPSVAVITSIGTAHIHNFKTQENILKEKMCIVEHMKDKKVLYVNADDAYLNGVLENDSYRLQHYSLNDAWDIVETNYGISFTTAIYGRKTRFSLHLYGKYFVRNVVLAIRIAEVYGIKYENIVKAIQSFQPIAGRFQVLQSDSNITVIDDTYNSCLESVLQGLYTSSRMSSKRKIAVLGTIASGANGKEDTSLAHDTVGEYFQNLNFDYLFLTGDYTKHLYKGAFPYFLPGHIKRFRDKHSLLQELVGMICPDDLIYIKDAGLQGFEELVDALKNQYHLF